MLYSKNKTLIIVLLLALVSSVCAGDKTFVLLQKNRYFKAIAGWEKQATATGMSETKFRALYGQSLAFNKLGHLYKDFYRFNLALSNEYYGYISKNSKSSLINLYWGQVEFYQGNYAKATQRLQKVLALKKVNPLIKDMAYLFKHFATQKLRKGGANIAFKTKYPQVIKQINGIVVLFYRTCSYEQ